MINNNKNRTATLVFGWVTMFFCGMLMINAQSDSMSEDEAFYNDEVASGNICEVSEVPFRPGENLEYKLYYNWTALWIPAGIANFKVSEEEINGRSAYHLHTQGTSVKSYEWFYKVNDVYETYIDKEDFRPLRFIRNINEGGFTKTNQYTFNPDQNTVHIDHMIRKGEMKREDETLEVSPCVHDIVSIIYYTRCINFDGYQPGERINFDLFLDGETHNVHVEYLGKETIKTKMGKIKCIKFRPSLIKGDLFADEDGMTVWATDDENKVPVYVESPLTIGKVRGYLVGYEGLAYEFGK